MKRKIKFAIGICFFIEGIYRVYISTALLLTRLSMFSQISDALNASFSFVRFHGWVAYWGEIIQMLIIFVYAAMCINISIKQVNWPYILWCGIIGVSAYLLSALYAASIHSMNIDLLFSLIKYSAIPTLIIGFALFCKKQQEKEHYYPVSCLLKKGKM